jgi:glucose/arabinose dehydrogenase
MNTKQQNRQFLIICFLLALSGHSFSQQLDTVTIAKNLEVPWEILWGPDDYIWCTERPGVVSKINPETGAKKILLTIPDVHTQSEAGLLGMAIHPAFKTIPHVFLVYNYKTGNDIKEKVVRYEYSSDSLVNPKIILSEIRGNVNHNGSRIIFLKDTTLLMTTGDRQQENIYPLDTTVIEGKIIRFNPDGSIPLDNPFPGTAIWTYGHRNPQGLVQLPDGTIMSSEHGPSTDDEINIITKKGNYGWPKVQGLCNTSAEQIYCQQNMVVEPIKVWTPTLATAGLDYYDNDKITEWKNSLLLVTLKESDLRVLKLDEQRRTIISEKILYNNAWGRLRDLCVSTTGDIYVATSNRDGRGSPRLNDDKIIKIFSKSTTGSKLIKNNQNLRNIRIVYNKGIILLNGVDFSRNYTLAIYSNSGRLLFESGSGAANVLYNVKLSNGTYLAQITGKGFESINSSLLVIN